MRERRLYAAFTAPELAWLIAQAVLLGASLTVLGAIALGLLRGA